MFLKKSTALILLIALIFTLSLSGCRKKSPKEKQATYEGIELTYYKMFDDGSVIDPVIKEYEAAHPGLKIKYKKFTNFDEYQKVVLNEMAEGEGPDIFSMQNTWFMSNYKKISPMPMELGSTEDFLNTFVDVAFKDLVRPDKDGVERVYALPMTVDTLALYYNKAHYEDRVPTRGKPAKTWEGIKEDVALLTKTDNSFERFEVAGIAMGRGDNISRSVDTLYLMFLQFGAQFYNENFSEATFASQQGGIAEYPGMEALKLYASFADQDEKHYSWNEFIVDDDSSEKELEAFAKGKVSMIVGFSYTYDEILNQISILKQKGIDTIDESDIRIAPMPQLYDPDASTEKRVTYASYFAETVSRNSKYPDIAWDFLIELTKKENLEYYFDKLHNPTSRRDMIETQKQHPIYGVFASQIGFAESFPILDYYVYKNLFINVISNANLNGAIQGDLLEAQNIITEMLPEEGLIVPKVKKEDEVDKKKDKDKNKE